ncbi:MAG TPA: hypothetical protein VHZ03_51180 [Trebonia sp.]|jgi:hypothetical protein|nr:hypothetical protein [Trebonia sp.]
MGDGGTIPYHAGSGHHRPGWQIALIARGAALAAAATTVLLDRKLASHRNPATTAPDMPTHTAQPHLPDDQPTRRNVRQPGFSAPPSNPDPCRPAHPTAGDPLPPDLYNTLVHIR